MSDVLTYEKEDLGKLLKILNIKIKNHPKCICGRRLTLKNIGAIISTKQKIYCTNTECIEQGLWDVKPFLYKLRVNIDNMIFDYRCRFEIIKLILQNFWCRRIIHKQWCIMHGYSCKGCDYPKYDEPKLLGGDYDKSIN